MSSSLTAEHEIDVGSGIETVSFTPDGECLVIGGSDGIQVRRVQNGRKIARITWIPFHFATVSNDGRWIAGIVLGGEVIVLDAQTQKKVWSYQAGITAHIFAADFSPDSTRFVTGSGHLQVTVWEVSTWKQLQRFNFKDSSDLVVYAAKFSPNGDRIATATRDRIQVYDSNNGRLLFGISIGVTRGYNHGLVWSSSHLFVEFEHRIIKIDACTGSTVFVWKSPVQHVSSIAMPRHERFIAFATDRTVAIFHAWTHEPLGVIQRDKHIRSIAFSPNDQLIAIGRADGIITVKRFFTIHDDEAIDSSASEPASILREWVKSELLINSWQNTLAVAVSLEFFTSKRILYCDICDHLERTDRLTEALDCFQQMNNELPAETNTSSARAKWEIDFKERCVKKFVCLGDAHAISDRHDDAITYYSLALSFDPDVPNNILVKRAKAYMAKRSWEDALDDTNQVIELVPTSPWNHENVLREWVKVNLTDGSWKNALSPPSSFMVPRPIVYKMLCEHLWMADLVTDAIECAHEMTREMGQEIGIEEEKWFVDFTSRSCKKLEGRGDVAMIEGRYENAISLYSAAFQLDPTTPRVLFVKRSKAQAARGMWEDALNDANEAITVDPASPEGYEQKYLALRGAGRYQDALYAFETMFTKMSESTDADIRERCSQYKNTRKIIRKAVQDAIRKLPPVLIDTTTGGLCDQTQQAAAFESQPIFTDLLTPHVDHEHIKQEVAKYYCYAMFSHKWEDYEPLYEKVMRIAVHDLEDFPTHNKLQMFCGIARDAGFRWAWSDTCCINKADHFVLQEALISMFKWYQGSSLTIVFLRGVSPPSQRGDLMESIWNTRAWTFQEYHASKVVRFYNEKWTLYRDLDIPNHKESPEIISEMEEATGISARALTELRPGLDSIREKLCLASHRETTLVEDAAYSLFGIFSVALPVVYGEGDHALGRLLARLLTSTGDTSTLAWTGSSGNFNSCLPAEIAVFTQLPTTHVPLTIKATRMRRLTARLRTSPLRIASIMNLYHRLDELSLPFFAEDRLKLPCISFSLGRLAVIKDKPDYVFRAQTTALGVVEINTREDLSRFDSLILVHPWIDFLLDRHPVGGVTETELEPITGPPETAVGGDEDLSSPSGSSSYAASSTTSGTPPTPVARLMARLGLGRSSSKQTREPSLLPPSSVLQSEIELQALQVLARLRQPFGALLLSRTRPNVPEYRRVASESMIRVQVEKITPEILNKLVERVRIVDVL